jgi:hypothetical protein
MAREPRQILPTYLTEITLKTFQSRFLLAPSSMVNQIIAGIVGRAQRLHKLRIVSIIVMSNHAHVLVVPDSPEQIEAFCRDVASQISKKVGRDLRDWKDGVFRRRYSAIVVTNEEAAQAERLAYHRRLLLGSSLITCDFGTTMPLAIAGESPSHHFRRAESFGFAPGSQPLGARTVRRLGAGHA